MASKLADFKTDAHNDWCPGCGDFGIVNSIQMALAEMGLPRHKTALFTGIGCSGKTSHFVNVYGVHTLHGRVLTFAQGAKLANPHLTVLAAGGDVYKVRGPVKRAVLCRGNPISASAICIEFTIPKSPHPGHQSLCASVLKSASLDAIC